MKKLITIVVPSYNVENTVLSNAKNIISELNKITKDFEVVFIDDGSLDKTKSVLNKIKNLYPDKVFVYSYKKNMGKGHALRYGFTKSSSEIVGFIDADGDINPKSIHSLHSIMVSKHADIVVGSKRDRKSTVEARFYRKVISNISQFIIIKLFKTNVLDTQAGIKLFKNDVIQKTLPYLKINGYAFDVEILAFANKFGFNRVFEAPIFVSMEKSKSIKLSEMIRFIVELFRTFFELFSIYFRLLNIN